MRYDLLFCIVFLQKFCFVLSTWSLQVSFPSRRACTRLTILHTAAPVSNWLQYLYSFIYFHHKLSCHPLLSVRLSLMHCYHHLVFSLHCQPSPHQPPPAHHQHDHQHGHQHDHHHSALLTELNLRYISVMPSALGTSSFSSYLHAVRLIAGVTWI